MSVTFTPEQLKQVKTASGPATPPSRVQTRIPDGMPPTAAPTPQPSAAPAQTPLAPPPSPRTEKESWAEAGRFAREQLSTKQKTAEQESRLKEAQIARENALTGDTEGRNKLLQGFIEATKAWHDKPTDENFEKAQRAGDLFYGRRLEGAPKVYRPTKQESVWRSEAANKFRIDIPDSIPLDQLNPQQMMARQTIIVSDANEVRQRQSLNEQRMLTIEEEAQYRLKTAPEKEEFKRKMDVLKIKLADTNREIGRLENAFSATGAESSPGNAPVDIKALKATQEEIKKKIDALVPGAGSASGGGDVAAAAAAYRQSLKK
jgi:hypothetical protein